jgi:hypothetical protein
MQAIIAQKTFKYSKTCLKLTTDRSWNSGQHKQVVNLHKCIPK